MVVRDEARTGASLLLDIATVDCNAVAHVTTQGTTAADNKTYAALDSYEKRSTSVGSIKLEREKGFPKEVLKLGFIVDTFNSKAAVEIDRRRILNAICHVDADQLDEVVPLEDHEEF